MPAYARVANRLPKNKLVVGVTLFFASHLVLFWSRADPRRPTQHLGLVFFVWVGIFNMMVVAQFWAFANDLYTQEQGKRLFALVGIGASVGAALGAYVTSFLEGHARLGVFELLLVSGAMLVGALCSRSSRTCASADERPKPEAREGSAKAGRRAKHADGASGAFELVFKHRTCC